MELYATPADVARPPWNVEAENVDTLLWYATVRVAAAAGRNPYSDSPTGTDAAVLRDAVCAQAASWFTTDVDPAAAGVGGQAPVKVAKLLSGEVQFDTTAQSTLLARLADGALADGAETILRAAGLLWAPMPVGDDTPCLPSWGLDTPWASIPLAERPWC